MGIEIISLGEAMVEFNQSEKGGDYKPGFGGDTSNCAVAAARQGASVGYITALGTDPFGDQLVAMWEAEGVSVEGVRRNPDAPSGIYFVTHTDSGHHFTYYRKGSAASRMTPDELPKELIRSAKILHISGISQAISDSACDSVFAAIDLAKEASVTVSYDTNLRLALWSVEQAREVIQKTAAMSDIVLPGLDDAVQLTGLNDPDAIVDAYLELGAATVGLTMGEEGAIIATAQRRERLAPYRVDCVDATGAGDTFDGALLARLTQGDDVFSAARYANAAAALSTTGFGAIAPIPRPKDVDILISRGLLK